MIGVALGYIIRRTVAAAVGSVAWVLFVEQIIVRAGASQQLKWLVSGTAQALTTPLAHGFLTPSAATAVLSGYALALLAAAARLVLRRDVA